MGALQVDFIGLLHYVENTNRTRLGIVLPSAPDHHSTIEPGPDSGTTILRQGMPIQELDFVGKRVSFRFTFDSSPPADPLDFYAVLNGSVQGAVRFNDIAGNFLDRRVDILSSTPPDTIAAQIFIDHGSFSIDSEVSVEWKIPQVLVGDGSGAPKLRTIAETIHMEVPNVSGVEIIFESLPNDPRPDSRGVYQLGVGDDGGFSLTVSHECNSAATQVDDDFVYHFDMLEEATLGQIARHLIRRKPEFPLPFRTVWPIPDPATGGPNTCNCLSCYGLPRDF